MAARFWVYIDSKIQGPVDLSGLRKVPGFNLLTQVCLEGEQTWRVADEVIEIKSYFLSPPRVNSFVAEDGNAARQLDLSPTPSIDHLPHPQTEPADVKFPLAELDPAALVEKAMNPAASIENTGGAAAGPAKASLRAVCQICGYKNPRDVNACMKCGEALQGGASATVAAPAPAVTTPEEMVLPAQIKDPEPPAYEPPPMDLAPAPAPVADLKSGTTIDIPIARLAILITVAAAIVGASFFGIKTWKKKHKPKAAKAVPVAVRDKSPVMAAPAGPPLKAAVKPSKPRPLSYTQASLRHREPVPSRTERAAAAPETPHEASDRAEGASYRVIEEAAPLKNRNSAPLDSPYTAKRRANQELWNTQEGRAIQQVQRWRIYGGLRTVDRNADILMQVLRDREYNTAFEGGKRIWLYNDMDWSAEQKEGPVYEVRLTFSGGREPDGSAKRPLRFAFDADLERGTVKPGGQAHVRSNTMHAFFDESRIAPEDRRAIAKDTEQLVLAAQPGASPLAFDTVIRQFAKVYGTDATARVGNAFGLADVKKKLTHDPRLGSDDLREPAAPPAKASKRVSLPGLVDRVGSDDAVKKAAGATAKEPPAPALRGSTKGGLVDFRAEPGPGKEKTFFLRATSRASRDRLWEVATGYDRLKQFMPDMIVSERSGQDGAATIVHTVCLTRFMFFVFKVNLHLRVIEHPAQRQLEFERIAGDFEGFRGAMEIATDPATLESVINFRATVTPSGRMASWVMEGMAKRLLVGQLNALRLRAETQ